MSATIDMSGMTAAHLLAIAELRRVPAEMARIVKWGAAYERATHAYTNRTGNLQRSTVGDLSRHGNLDATATMIMGMPYASFVANLGYSDFDDTAKTARSMIESMLGRLGVH